MASIENKSEHPIARAIVNFAEKQNIKLKEVTKFRAIPGYGVYSKIEDDEVYIGNRQLMLDNNIKIENDDEIDLTKRGNSVLFVSKNGELIALIGVKDTIRDNAKETIQKLKDRNINIVMLTGDNEKTAKFIAEEVGITNVIANVKPKEKAENVKAYKQKQENKKKRMQQVEENRARTAKRREEALKRQEEEAKKREELRKAREKAAKRRSTF